MKAPTLAIVLCAAGAHAFVGAPVQPMGCTTARTQSSRQVVSYPAVRACIRSLLFIPVLCRHLLDATEEALGLAHREELVLLVLRAPLCASLVASRRVGHCFFSPFFYHVAHANGGMRLRLRRAWYWHVCTESVVAERAPDRK